MLSLGMANMHHANRLLAVEGPMIRL